METVADACDATINRPADVISDKRTYYDGGSFGAAPTKGDVTKTDQINGKGDGYDTISTTAASDFDNYGRALKVTDTYGKTTTTAYAPTTGEAPTQTVVTNPLGQAVTTVLDPLRGQPTQVTDANGRISTTNYDPLGRTSKVWTPARPAATNPTSPSYTFDYQVRNDAPVVVTTKKLDFNSVYQPSYAFYDGLLRSVQTQAPSPDGSGRLVTETLYDTRGFAWRSSGTYYADGKAEPVLVTGQETNYPASSDILYDGAGRTTASIDKKFGDEVKRTTTTYTGDTTTVIPPQGGTATTTVTDARGRTTELKQYTNTDRTTSQSTTYTYDKRGLLGQMADPSGAKWSYTYDVRGRQTQVDDPDKGTSTTVYDAGDRAIDITDARGITLHTDYDALGRPIDRKQGTTTLATWTYDGASGGKGQPYTATRYVGGNAYASQVNNYNALYEPVGTQVTIPASEGDLAGTYKWITSYNANTGQPMWSQQPAIGDLPQEKVSNTYTANSSLPYTLYAGNSALVSAMTYDHYGRVAQEQYGQFGALLRTSNEYDENTSELTRQFTDRDTAPQRIDDNHYTYDPAGDVTSISTTTGQDNTAVTDTQCFTLDPLQRVNEAWTATDQCQTTPSSTSSSTVGGPDAYWTSYTYDPVGNRKTEVQHQTPSGPSSDVTRAYATPASGTHVLPSVTQSSTDGASQETFTYDKDGNTATRVIGGNTQILDWDAEGHLADTKGSSTTAYVYDASGNRLIRKDSTGSTLYLPGGNELHLAQNGTTTGTRYYSLAGQTVAMLTGGKLTFLLADPHGTATTQVDATTQAVTRRKTTIFGTPRGTQPSNWAGDKGFVGGTLDPDTTLTHLGAREYDPTLGRFISVDPLLNPTNTQQSNGYTYANNNPVTLSDPNGTRPIGPGDNDQENQEWALKNHVDHYGWETDRYGGWDWYETRSGSGPGGDSADLTYTVPSTLGYENGEEAGYSISNVQHPQEEFQRRHPLRSQLVNLAVGVSVGMLFDNPEMGFMDEGPTTFAADSEATSAAEADSETAAQLGPCNHSFLPDTSVLLANGKPEKIKEVKVGDEVTATEPSTGKTTKRKVAATIITKHDKDFTDLTIKTADGDKSIIATDTHPFWTTDKKTWTNAGNITPGTRLRTPGGQTVTVTDVRHYHQQQTTRDLTIADTHTYYVLAGTTPVLVHNCDPYETLQAEHADGQYLYRGVPEGHPGFQNATEGRAVPRGGQSNPVEHNDGSTDSPFTSWTTSPRVARRYAAGVRPGETPGVILRLRLPTPDNPLRQMALFGEDKWGESEVLMENEVNGATIFDLR
ncbi:RHS repeat-associated core domain-containing protein [Streptomyces sp. NPDC054933]